jgi:hypothetical protein
LDVRSEHHKKIAGRHGISVPTCYRTTNAGARLFGVAKLIRSPSDVVAARDLDSFGWIPDFNGAIRQGPWCESLL